MHGWVKSCTTCGAEKLLTDFRRRTRAPGGRENSCKSCRNARAREIDRLHRLGIKIPPRPERSEPMSVAMQRLGAWPKYRVDVLVRERDEGRSYTQIGQTLGITKGAAVGKMWRLGLCNGGESTTMQRLDALHAKMDTLLAECAKLKMYRPRLPPEVV